MPDVLSLGPKWPSPFDVGTGRLESPDQQHRGKLRANRAHRKARRLISRFRTGKIQAHHIPVIQIGRVIGSAKEVAVFIGLGSKELPGLVQFKNGGNVPISRLGLSRVVKVPNGPRNGVRTCDGHILGEGIPQFCFVSPLVKPQVGLRRVVVVRRKAFGQGGIPVVHNRRVRNLQKPPLLRDSQGGLVRPLVQKDNPCRSLFPFHFGRDNGFASNCKQGQSGHQYSF